METDIVQHIPIEYLNRSDSKGRLEAARLELSTYFSSRVGVISQARVEFCRGNTVTFQVYGDFYKRVKLTRPVQTTQKVIAKQHAREFAPEKVAAILAAVRQHYAVLDVWNSMPLAA